MRLDSASTRRLEIPRTTFRRIAPRRLRNQIHQEKQRRQAVWKPESEGADDMIDPSDAALRQMFSAALASGGAWAELFTERTTVTELTGTTGNGLTAARSRVQGVGLRVGLGRDTALVYSTDHDHASLVELGSTAAAVFRAVRGREPAERTPAPAVRIGRTDRAGTAATGQLLDLTDKRLLVETALDAARQPGGRARAAYADREREIGVWDSLGGHAAKTDWQTRLQVDVALAGPSATGTRSWCAALPSSALTVDEAAAVGAGAAEQALRLESAVPARAGTRALVCGPDAAGLLIHELCGHALEADALALGSSIFAGSLGTAVADSAVTVVDGGAPAGAWGVSAVDDEGTAPERTELIRAGIMVGSMTDRLHAAASADRRSSGNARRRSFEHPPLPRMTQTTLESGTTSRQDIIAGVGTGLLVLEATGGTVDPVTGRFSLVVKEGWEIESGEPTRIVTGSVLTGDARSSLRDICAVGDDPQTFGAFCGKGGQWLPVSYRSPSLALARISVGGV
jgi:TldD protein